MKLKKSSFEGDFFYTVWCNTCLYYLSSIVKVQSKHAKILRNL